jgi:hypothetical protein
LGGEVNFDPLPPPKGQRVPGQYGFQGLIQRAGFNALGVLPIDLMDGIEKFFSAQAGFG